MSHILSIKLPHPLLQELDSASAREGVSKGALVRQALELFLRQNTLAQQVARITRTLRKRSTSKHRPDWTDIYAKTRIDTGMTVEEEIARSRRRNL